MVLEKDKRALTGDICENRDSHFKIFEERNNWASRGAIIFIVYPRDMFMKFWNSIVARCAVKLNWERVCCHAKSWKVQFTWSQRTYLFPRGKLTNKRISFPGPVGRALCHKIAKVLIPGFVKIKTKTSLEVSWEPWTCTFWGLQEASPKIATSWISGKHLQRTMKHLTAQFKFVRCPMWRRPCFNI